MAETAENIPTPELKYNSEYLQDWTASKESVNKLQIVVRKKDNTPYSGGLSSRLAMTSEVPVAVS